MSKECIGKWVGRVCCAQSAPPPSFMWIILVCCWPNQITCEAVVNKVHSLGEERSSGLTLGKAAPFPSPPIHWCEGVGSLIGSLIFFKYTLLPPPLFFFYLLSNSRFLCSFGACPATCSVDQAVLELIEIRLPPSDSQLLGLSVCVTTTQLYFPFWFICCIVVLGVGSQALGMLGKSPTLWATRYFTVKRHTH